GDRVLGDRRQHEGDDVTLADAAPGQRRRDLVGDAVEIAVGHDELVLAHVRGPVAEPPRRLTEQLTEHVLSPLRSGTQPVDANLTPTSLFGDERPRRWRAGPAASPARSGPAHHAQAAGRG